MFLVFDVKEIMGQKRHNTNVMATPRVTERQYPHRELTSNGQSLWKSDTRQ